MSTNTLRILSAIVILSLSATACGLDGTPSPAPVEQPAAPVSTVRPVALPIATDPVRIQPVPIGSNEILPPAANIIVLDVDETSFLEVNRVVEQYTSGNMTEALIVTGLLQLILDGINAGLCNDMSSNFVDHLRDGNFKRLRRLGGWLGVERFYKAMQAGKYELRAILVSKDSKWNVAFLMVIDGIDHLFVLTTGGGSNTVVPLSVIGSDLVDWLMTRSKNYIERDAANKIARGVVFADAEVRSILQTGTFALDAGTVGMTAFSFAKLGKCIEAKVKAQPEYQAWEQKGRPDTAKIDVLYETEYDLVLDMQVLQDLGLTHNLVNNAAAERHGILALSIAGTAIGAWIIAPVVIPVGSFGVTVETVRYALIIGTVAP